MSQTFCDHIGATYGIEAENLAVIDPERRRGGFAATWVHDYAPNIRALVLASPAFKVKLYVPCRPPGPGVDAALSRQLFRQQLRQGQVPQP
jgi:hypothetical protein